MKEKDKPMKNYIFITTEGYTYQPGSEAIEPDVENCQVIGFASGKDNKDAFNNLLTENKHLLKMKSDEIICYRLADRYKNTRKSFFISGSNC